MSDMTHYREDDLVLFLYGEGRRRDAVQRHLDICPMCSALYSDIAETMKLVAAPQAPERDERYGLEVWQRIRPELPVGPPPRSPLGWVSRALALQLALGALIVVAFVAGREWPRTETARMVPAARQPAAAGVPGSTDAADRIRMAAIGDHLEQSERLLIDFVNAGGPVVDVSSQQALAADLVDANRFYREAATSAGDETVADVLDALERNLIEIAHGPSTLSPADFNKMRMRLDAAALLFKVRVLSDELHEREISTAKPPRHDA
jgi:hypothetical protein